MATFLETEFTVTLMRLTELGYVESGDKTFTYYFAAPDSWATLPDATLQQRVFEAAGRMYSALNARLRAAEPSDPNYLHVKSTRSRVLSQDEASSWPWVSAEKPVWEPTPAFVLHADGTFEPVNVLELGNAVPAERKHVRLDRILPVLLSKQLPACASAYEQVLPRFQDPRPLDERSRLVWGTAILLCAVLDRLATGGEYADPFATVDRMADWLVEDGEAPAENVDAAKQIFKRMFEHNVFRPNSTLFEFVYERAWSVRYSDLDPNAPSAFQGFVRCLTAARDTLHAFDFDDPGRGGLGAKPRAYEKIETFTRTAVLPAFEEIKATLERHGKRVFVSETDRFGDEFLESFYREIHPSARYPKEMLETPPVEGAKYVGYTIVAVDPEPATSRYAGKFFESIMLTVGPNDEVYASPFVIYHMKFDNKLHGFQHRFDNNIERHGIEAIDKYAIQNHFLGAYDFFKINAKRDERPW